MLNRLINLFQAPKPVPSVVTAAVPVVEVPPPSDPPLVDPAVASFMERVGAQAVPVYPDQSEAVIAAPAAIVLATQDELIAQIKDHCALSPQDFERYIRPVLLRYTEWVHLLPASEMHHHCNVGGLLRHGLEVAMHAARTAEGQYVGLDLNPRQRMNYMQRWKVATLIGALLHDIGKPLVDITCVNIEGTLTWAPQAESLLAWLDRNSIQHYVYFWRNAGSRHQRHKSVATSVAREIIGAELLSWLSEDNCAEVVSLLLITLADTGESTNTMAHIVHTADSTSVDYDLAQQAKWASRNNQGQHRSIAALVLAALRKRVETGKWKINSDGPLYLCEQGLFGVFPAVLTAAMEDMREAGHRAMPHDMLDMAGRLSDFHYIERPTDIDGLAVSYTWSMSLVPSEETPKFNSLIPLKVLKFSRQDLILGHLPPPTLVKANISSAINESKRASLTVELVSSDTPATAVGTAETPVTGVVETAMPTEANEPENNAIEIEDRRERIDAATLRQREIKDAIEPNKTPAEWATYLAKNCLGGMALTCVFDAVRNGKLVFGKDVMIGDDFIGIRFPHAFESIGLTTNDLLQQLHAKGWVRGAAGMERKTVTLSFPKGGAGTAIQLIHAAFEGGASILGASSSELEPAATPTKPAAEAAQNENSNPSPATASIGQPASEIPSNSSVPAAASPEVIPEQPEVQGALEKTPAAEAQNPVKQPAAKPALKRDPVSMRLAFRNEDEVMAEKHKKLQTHGPSSMSELRVDHMKDMEQVQNIAITAMTWLHLYLIARHHGLAHVSDLDSKLVKENLVNWAREWGIHQSVYYSALCESANPLCMAVDDKRKKDMSITRRGGFKVLAEYVPPKWALERAAKGKVNAS